MFPEESLLQPVCVMSLRAELDIDQKPELRPYYREEVLCLKTTYSVGSMLEAPEFGSVKNLSHF